eukprot:8924562-Prorocentrum_lima.AAC.1
MTRAPPMTSTTARPPSAGRWTSRWCRQSSLCTSVVLGASGKTFVAWRAWVPKPVAIDGFAPETL